MFRTRAAAVVSLLLMCFVARMARAQGSSDNLPRAFVEGLLNGCACGEGRVVLGEPAPDLPPELIPERGQVLGSLVGQATTTVIQIADPDGAAAALERQAVNAGWSQPSPYQGSGFVPAYQMRPTVLCREGRHLTLSALTASDGAGVLRVSLWRGGPSCEDQAAMYRHPGQDLPMPVLRVPPGSEMSGGGGTSGVDYASTAARITSRQPIVELLNDFEGQAERAGWKSLDRLSSDDLQVRTFQMVDGQKRYKGLLSAVVLSEDQYNFEFEVLQLPK